MVDTLSEIVVVVPLPMVISYETLPDILYWVNVNGLEWSALKRMHRLFHCYFPTCTNSNSELHRLNHHLMDLLLSDWNNGVQSSSNVIAWIGQVDYEFTNLRTLDTCNHASLHICPHS